MTDLAAVIKAVESNGNPYRPRFEFSAFMRWPWSAVHDRITRKHLCSEDTAKMIGATSWGAYQMLGVNIFDQDISGVDPDHLFAYVADSDMQDASFAGFVKAKGIDFTLADLLGDADKMQQFVSRWNGPGNIAGYSALIRKKATEVA